MVDSPAVEKGKAEREAKGRPGYVCQICWRTYDAEPDEGGKLPPSINADPVLVIEGESVTETTTRDVTLTILAFGGSQMKLSNDSVLTGAQWELYATEKSWQLTTGGNEKVVYMRILYLTNDTSEVVTDTILPVLPSNLSVTIVEGDSSTSNLVDLSISADNADSMRIGNQADLSAVEWVAYGGSVEDWDLGDGGGALAAGESQSGESIIRTRPTRGLEKNVLGKTSKLPSKKSSSSGAQRLRPDEILSADSPRSSASPPRLVASEAMVTTSHTVYAQFKNDFEAASDVVSDQVIVHIPGAITINGGDATTSSRFVTLTLSCDYADLMALDTSATALAAGPNWQTYAATISDFELPTGAGTKSVYVIFHNSSGAESDIYSDDIAPQLIENEAIEIIGTVAADTVNSNIVDIELNADYADSVMLSGSSDFTGAEWIAMADTVYGWDIISGSIATSASENIRSPVLKNSGDSFADKGLVNRRGMQRSGTAPQRNPYIGPDLQNVGPYTVYAKYKNDFEVETNAVSDGVVLHAACSISINGGDATTTSRFVTLSLSSDFDYQIALDTSGTNIAASPTWQTYGATVSDFELLTGAGTKSVYVIFRNSSGAESDIYSDDIAPQLIENEAIEIIGTVAADTVNSNIVDIELNADYADSVMLSGSSDFTGAEWIAMADTVYGWDIISGSIATSASENIRSPVLKNSGDSFADKGLVNRRGMQRSGTAPQRNPYIGPDLQNVGPYTVYAKYKNDFEVETNAVSDGVVLHAACSISINGGDATTTSRFVTLSLSSDFDYQIALDTSGTNIAASPTWQTYGATVSDFELLTGAGTKSVYVIFRNSSGAESEIYSDDIQAQLVVNEAIEIISSTADDTVSSNLVDIKLSADYADSAMLSNSGSFTGGTWVAMVDTLFGWDLTAAAASPPAVPDDKLDLSRSKPAGNPEKADLDQSLERERAARDEIDVVRVPRTREDAVRVPRTRDEDVARVPKTKTRESVSPEDAAPDATLRKKDLFGGPPLTYEPDATDHAVYAKFKNSFEVETTPYSDNITVALRGSVTINGGDAYTASRDVTLTLSLMEAGSADSMALDVNYTNIVSSPTWQAFSSTVSNYTLPAGNGFKRVYTRFKNNTGVESDIFSDEIDPVPLTPTLTILPADSEFINHTQVTLDVAVANADSFKVHTSNDSSAVPWEASDSLRVDTLSTGDSLHHVYAWYKHDFFAAGPAVDSIYLDTGVSIDSIIWNPVNDTLNQWTAYDTLELLANDTLEVNLQLADDAAPGPDSGGVATITIKTAFSQWNPVSLADSGNGLYTSIFMPGWNADTISYSKVILSLTDRAGNTLKDTANTKLSFYPYRTYSLGDTTSDEAYGMVALSDGGVVMAGTFSNGSFIIRTDSLGNVVDQDTLDYGPKIQRIRQTSDGGYIAVGYYYDGFSNQLVLRKFDSSLTPSWTRYYGGTGTERGYDVQQTLDGGYIAVGHTTSYGGGGYDIYMVKTDASGDTSDFNPRTWVKWFGGSGSDYGQGVQQAPDSGYVVGGHSYSDTTWSSKTYLDNSDLLMIKTNKYGTKMWDQVQGGASYDYGYALAKETHADSTLYILVGYTDSFGNGNQVYMVKVKDDSTSGTFRFGKNFGGAGSDYGRDIQITSDGGYIIAGQTDSYGAGSSDFYVIKTTSSGSESWSKTFGGTSSEYGRTIAQSPDGRYFVAGATWGFNASNTDIMLVRFAP